MNIDADQFKMSKKLVSKTIIIFLLLISLNNRSYAGDSMKMKTISPINHKKCLNIQISLNNIIIEPDFPLDVFVNLTNICDHSITINQRFYHIGPDIFINIYDVSGKQLSFLPHGPPPPVTEDLFKQLDPHKIVSFSVKNIAVGLYDKLTPGTYKLNIVFKNILRKADGFSIEEFKSNTLTFTVKGDK